MTKEKHIEQSLIARLSDFKYIYREDILDRVSLEKNFREKFEDLNKVKLTDSEFVRLRDMIISADGFASAKILRENNHFERKMKRIGTNNASTV